MHNDYIWRQEIECGGFAGLKPFLVRLSEDNNCRLKILRDRSTFWKDKLTVEFQGTTENLSALQNEFLLSMTMFNLPSDVKSANYNITAITEEESSYSREKIFKVNASKSSEIEKLVEAVADEVLVCHDVSEKSNGFFKGKTVHISVLGDDDKLQKFKAIFLSVLQDAEAKKQKKYKRGM
jgi:hypothetical protein